MVVLRTLKKDNCMSFVQFLVNYMFIYAFISIMLTKIDWYAMEEKGGLLFIYFFW